MSNYTTQGLIAVSLGGLGSLFGAVAGGVLLGVMQAVVTGYVSSLFSTAISLPDSLPAGNYTLKTGVFTPDRSKTYAWTDTAGTFVVNSVSQAPPPPQDATADSDATADAQP